MGLRRREREKRKQAAEMPVWTQREAVPVEVPWYEQKQEPWYAQAEVPQPYERRGGSEDGGAVDRFMGMLVKALQGATDIQAAVRQYFDTHPEAMRYFSFVNTNQSEWAASLERQQLSRDAAANLVGFIVSALYSRNIR